MSELQTKSAKQCPPLRTDTFFPASTADCTAFLASLALLIMCT